MKNTLNGIEYEPILSPEERIKSFLETLDNASEALSDFPKVVTGLQLAKSHAECWFADEVEVINKSKIS